MAQSGKLGKVFDRNIERLTQSLKSEDLFDKFVLAPLPFVRPVAQFIWKIVKKKSEVINNENNLRDASFFIPESQLQSS